MRDRLRSPQVVGALTLALGILAYLTFQSRYPLRFERNLMPLVLPVCILGGLALERCWALVKRYGAAVATAGVLALSMWVGVQVTKGVFEAGRGIVDERGAARQWMAENIADGDVVVGELGAPWSPGSRFSQSEVALLADVPLDDLRTGQIDWVVSSSETTSGVYPDEARWGSVIADYEQRFAEVCEWNRFRSWNIEIRIGRVCDADGRTEEPTRGEG